MTTLTPAFGRDYRSKADVLKDWNANKDFVIDDFFHPSDGKLINKSQLVGTGNHGIRYCRRTKLCPVNA